MAYLRRLWPRKCACCKRGATVELVNRYNSPVGQFCLSCGKKKLAELKKEEERADGKR